MKGDSVATIMWQRGRRLFSTAGILMILTAAAHTAGHFSPPNSPAEEQLLAAMRNFQIPMGLGMNPSMMDILGSLSLTVAITFFALGLINLLLAGSAETTERLLRRVTWVNVVWVGGFLSVCYVHHVLPPLTFAVVIEMVLLASLFLPQHKAA